MVFTLKPPPQPLRCYLTTKECQDQLKYSWGLSHLATIWKVSVQSREVDTIRLIQEAMIAHNIKAGSMPEQFTVQARVRLSMELTPDAKRKEDVAKMIDLLTSVRLPWKGPDRISKPRVRHGMMRAWFWSKGFPAVMTDRIYFLDGPKELELEDIQRAYPDVFPKLPKGLEYDFCDLKAGAHRG